MASPSSPCINVCELDPQTGYCRGCMRSMDEIVAWGTMSANQRSRIMREELPQRRRHIKNNQSK